MNRAATPQAAKMRPGQAPALNSSGNCGQREGWCDAGDTSDAWPVASVTVDVSVWPVTGAAGTNAEAGSTRCGR